MAGANDDDADLAGAAFEGGMLGMVAAMAQFDASTCTLVLQAGASYPVCDRGADSLCIVLASKPGGEIAAPLPILC